MSTSSKSVSSIQMGKRFEIRQGTAFFFMQKVRNSMKRSQKHPLSELVQLDEFTVGVKEQGKQGLSSDSKNKKVVIAVEINEKHQIKRVYVNLLDIASIIKYNQKLKQHTI